MTSFNCRQFSAPVVDSEARKVVLSVEGMDEADAGTYVNEYVGPLMMNGSGTLIEERLKFFES